MEDLKKAAYPPGMAVLATNQLKGYATLGQDTHKSPTTPATGTDDPLTALLQRGARELLRDAVEAELQSFLEGYSDHQLLDGRQAVVRRERTVTTGIGDVAVQ